MYYNMDMTKPSKAKDIKILYFDTETVTLESPAESCTFFQLSGMIEINGEEVERFNFFMNPDHSCEYNPESLEFNGITEDDLEQYPSHIDVFPKVLELFKKYVDPMDKNDKMHCVGYNNLKFDQDKLWNWFAMMDELKRTRIDEEYAVRWNKWKQTGEDKDKPGRKEKVYNTFGCYCWTNAIDVFPLLSLVFIRYRNLFVNFKLATVAKKMAQMKLIDSRFEDDDNWHDALFDIEATRELFHFALRMFQFNPFENLAE
jgi:hypothetical protein